jgi:hypothetical protein
LNLRDCLGFFPNNGRFSNRLWRFACRKSALWKEARAKVETEDSELRRAIGPFSICRSQFNLLSALRLPQSALLFAPAPDSLTERYFRHCARL